MAHLVDIVDHELVEREFADFSLLAARDFPKALPMEQIRQAVLSVRNARRILQDSNADFILFGDYPHHLLAYSLFTVCREWGISYKILLRGPVPNWGQLLGEAALFHDELPLADGTNLELPAEAAAFLRRVSSDDVSMPYMSKQFAERGSILRLAASRLKNPRLPSATALRGAMARKSLLSGYQRLCSPVDGAAGSIVVFLHYQPERTTMPQGGKWARQDRIVEALASACPGYELLVREHPSTFMLGAPPWRSIGFYEQLALIPRVRLIPTHVPQRRLVRDAALVVTVSGTIALEAVLRGTPVLAFGNGVYLGLEGVFGHRGASLKHRVIEATSKRPSTGALERYLRRLIVSDHVVVCEPEARYGSGHHERAALTRVLGAM